MKLLCTRPNCPHQQNNFSDLDDRSTLNTVQQKYCTSCGMPLILAGHYLPTQLLGRGGFGTAFLALDRFSPTLRQCVVKQFQPSENLTPQQLATAQTLFEREAIALEKLGNQHPRIPNLYAYFPLLVGTPGEEEQFFYLVQEYIDGQNLEVELAVRGKFSEAEVSALLKEMLEILQFVHENGSIHRDIKLSNLVRDCQGKLHLIDFGAVKQTVGSASPGVSTGIYSLGFAPPEQMVGKTVYPSSDLYALAVTCLNLLTGKSPDELFNTSQNPDGWRAFAPQISDRLAAIFDRMLQPSPGDRFQSAEAVLQVLSEQAGQHPDLIPTSAPILPKPKFSLLEILTGAAFVGFEGWLLYVAFMSLFPSPAIGFGIWGAFLGGLLYALSRRALEGKDLPILAILTFLALLFPALRGGMSFNLVAMLSILFSAGAIAITALFRLIYQILSRFL
jgi:serine/threonine protein kinase